MGGGIYQCVSLPQSVCECLQISFGVYTAGSLENALRCLGAGVGGAWGAGGIADH